MVCCYDGIWLYGPCLAASHRFQWLVKQYNDELFQVELSFFFLSFFFLAFLWWWLIGVCKSFQTNIFSGILGQCYT